MNDRHNYIAGRWVESSRYQTNLNPSKPSDIISRHARADVDDVHSAFVAAREALADWQWTSPQARSDVLRKTGDELLARSEELGTQLAREEGKTKREGIGEVVRSAAVFHYYAGEAFRGEGDIYPGLRDGFNVTVSREPVGVVSVITPWNFPMVIPAWKIAPALVYGNTVVFKPAETTPASAWELVDILIRSGLPAGVLNLVGGSGRELGDALIDGADAITFTGSTPIGRAILERGALGMKKIQLELGGKNPLIIAADANLDDAVSAALDGAFFSTGQRCTASSRLIVDQSVHDAFVEKLTERVQALRVGDALAEGTDIGPVVNEQQFRSVLEYIEIGQKEGAKLTCGGAPVETESGGYFIEPALFVGTTNEMRINREEIFGPVASVIKADNLEHAIAMANDTDFGLTSGIFTQSLRTAEQFRRASKAGMVMINAGTAGLDFHVPFGGRRPSGFGGSEQGQAAINFFTQLKTAYINHGVIRP